MPDLTHLGEGVVERGRTLEAELDLHSSSAGYNGVWSLANCHF